MLRYISILLCIILVVSFPSAAKAEPHFYVIPPWKRMTIGDAEYACYDFEAAKKLKLVDAQCKYDADRAVLLEEKLKIREDQVADLQKSFDELSQVVDEQKKAFSRVQDERDAAILASKRAEVRDILGGGFPWLVATAAVFFAGGAVAGIYIARK